MSRTTLRRVHLATSVSAVAIVASFVAATVSAEVLGGEPAVEAVKHWIVRALVVLVPTLAAAGLSGRRLAGASPNPVIRRKIRRTQVVAATGVLVLVPCAFTLDNLAARGDFDTMFVVVQVIELLAGASNLTLLALNLRDGMAMRARRKRARAPAVGRPEPIRAAP